MNKSDICEWGGVTFVNKMTFFIKVTFVDVTDVSVMQKLAYLVFAQRASLGDFLLDKAHGLFYLAIIS